MTKWLVLALGATVVLLLFADFLTFHDLFEPHTAKDWIILVASGLAAICLAGVSVDRLRASDQRG